MSVLMADTAVASSKTPKPEGERNRFDLRGDPVWFARIKRQAKRRGIKSTAYIKQAVSLQLEQDEQTDRGLKR